MYFNYPNGQSQAKPTSMNIIHWISVFATDSSNFLWIMNDSKSSKIHLWLVTSVFPQKPTNVVWSRVFLANSLPKYLQRLLSFFSATCGTKTTLSNRWSTIVKNVKTCFAPQPGNTWECLNPSDFQSFLFSAWQHLRRQSSGKLWRMFLKTTVQSLTRLMLSLLIFW